MAGAEGSARCRGGAEREGTDQVDEKPLLPPQYG